MSEIKEQLSVPSRKQYYLRELLRVSVYVLRGASGNLRASGLFRFFSREYHAQKRAIYELSEAIHLIPNSILEPEYTEDDIWMLNHHFRRYWEREHALRSTFGYYIFKLIEDMPDHLREELTWDGPVESELTWIPDESELNWILGESELE